MEDLPQPIATDGTRPVPESRPRVQSAARAVGVLLAVAVSENGLTAREISERMGTGRQATYHLLHTLVEAGMLTRRGRSHYLLGLKVGVLAEGFLRQLSPSDHLAPLVRALAQETGETAYASGWSGGEITVIAVTRGTRPVHAAEAAQGTVEAAHARASGKVLLAYASDQERQAYFDSHPLTRVTPQTTTRVTQLERNLKEIRQQGYAIDEEEFAEGLCCVAVPVGGELSRVALSISAPRDRFLERKEEYLAAALRMAERGSPTAPSGS